MNARYFFVGNKRVVAPSFRTDGYTLCRLSSKMEPTVEAVSTAPAAEPAANTGSSHLHAEAAASGASAAATPQQRLPTTARKLGGSKPTIGIAGLREIAGRSDHRRRFIAVYIHTHTHRLTHAPEFDVSQC